ncbi:Possible Mg2+ transport P-type ATPase C MgtC [Mycobacteroides abscessus subsp. massiliense]|nr:Possible Mg2+ transport P-type ATPase C MgtC [Mycobacteroides abscessus subsp. massiliense]
MQAVSRPEFALQSVRSYDVEDGKHVRVVAKLSAEERNDSLLESAVSRLSMEPPPNLHTRRRSLSANASGSAPSVITHGPPQFRCAKSAYAAETRDCRSASRS